MADSQFIVQQGLLLQQQTFQIQMQVIEEQQRQLREQQEREEKRRKQMQSASAKSTTCNEEQKGFLFYKAHVKCDSAGPNPKEMALLKERRSECEQFRKAFEDIEKACAGFKR